MSFLRPEKNEHLYFSQKDELGKWGESCILRRKETVYWHNGMPHTRERKALIAETSDRSSPLGKRPISIDVRSLTESLFLVRNRGLRALIACLSFLWRQALCYEERGDNANLFPLPAFYL